MLLDDVTIQFNENQVRILNFCLGFIMFGVALDLSFKDFGEVWRNKKSTIAGIISQLIFLPLLTIGLIWILKPSDSIAMGMLLIAVCPGGNVSNYAVHLARGNTALSVVLTFISTVTSSVFTPLSFAFLYLWLPASTHKTTTSLSVPFPEMIATVFTLMIIPLVAGIVFSKNFPDIRQKILPWVKRSSLLLFLGIIISGLISNLDNINLHLGKVFYIVLLHNSLALIGGFLLASAFGTPIKDKVSISIETGIQNSGLALVLIFNFFDGLGGMALIAAWWSIWHLISALTMALYFRSKT